MTSGDGSPFGRHSNGGSDGQNPSMKQVPRRSLSAVSEGAKGGIGRRKTPKAELGRRERVGLWVNHKVCGAHYLWKSTAANTENLIVETRD